MGGSQQWTTHGSSPPTKRGSTSKRQFTHSRNRCHGTWPDGSPLRWGCRPRGVMPSPTESQNRGRCTARRIQWARRYQDGTVHSVADLLSIVDLPSGFEYPPECIRTAELSLTTLDPCSILEASA